MLWVGLTGGIATGKSTVSRKLKDLGYPIIDADEIAKEVLSPNSPGLKAVIGHFGTDMLNPDGSLDRTKLANLVFKNKHDLKVLEGIVHPEVQKRVLELKDKYNAQSFPICFYDVPLLFENKLENEFDKIVVVACSKEKQMDRLMKRNFLDSNAARDRVNSQFDMDTKIKKADFVINNNGYPDELDSQIRKLIDFLNKK